ncbi:hypothetical protein A9P82_13250 [Arachidicoccus ginsenosidimutans]|uniref:hypothetical protein n=1 Tax=Arachidicoccus sp. BS20 TaxID=1850526 RepID=UPI0007F1342A|nr:hypothetical protein [Arachidicoccus sp. BS20]ANI90166.1 hypothetical protein A9P82_13250 [Arachidicoccus sp. BS20]
MRRILLAIFIFLVALFIIDRTFYYFFNKYIFAHTLTGEEGAGQVNYFLQNGQQYSCVILGSSRAKQQINPAKLTAIPGRAFNEGTDALGDIKYNNVLLDLLLNNHVCPKYVILQTDAAWLAQKENSSEQEIRLFFPYIGQSKVLGNYIHGMTYQEKLKLFLSKSYRFNGRILNILYNFRNRKLKDKNYGFAPFQEAMDSVTASNYFQKENHIDTSQDLLPIMQDALKNIIDNCKRHNIRLFIVLPPYFNNEVRNLSLLKKTINTFNDADIIDMSDIRKFPDLQNRLNWHDYLHLNETGANKFSAYLNDSLAVRFRNIQ